MDSFISDEHTQQFNCLIRTKSRNALVKKSQTYRYCLVHDRVVKICINFNSRKLFFVRNNRHADSEKEFRFLLNTS